MARITAQHELAATFAVEFESKLYFRVEIYRVATDQPVESTTYLSQVYHLRFPHGLIGMPSNDGSSTWRPYLHYLHDFKPVNGGSIESVRADTLRQLSDFADLFISKLPKADYRNHGG